MKKKKTSSVSFVRCKIFIYYSANLFPCKTCSKHFKQMLKENPVKNNNREELVLYLCGLHNIVNERLGKPIFDCQKAFDFWGGNCGCSLEKGEKSSPEDKPKESQNIIDNKNVTLASSIQPDKRSDQQETKNKK